MICLAKTVLDGITVNGGASVRLEEGRDHGLAHLSLTPQVSSVSLTCSCGVKITWVFNDRRTAERWASRICQAETGVVSGATANASLTELCLPSGASLSLSLMNVGATGRLGVRKVQGGRLCLDWEPMTILDLAEFERAAI